MKRHKKAFTLIELLVVVLIIGILAAVAVPQYKFAVEKARTAEAITVINSLQKAIDLYVLENGYQYVELVGDTEADDAISGKLDIDVESILDCKGENTNYDPGEYCYGKNFLYTASCNPNGCFVEAFRVKDNDIDVVEYSLAASKRVSNNGQWVKSCVPTRDGDEVVYPYSEKLCKSLQAQGWN